MELYIKHSKISEGSNPYDQYVIDIWKVIEGDRVICKCEDKQDAELILLLLKKERNNEIL